MTPEPTVQDETANNSDDSPADGIQRDHAYIDAAVAASLRGSGWTATRRAALVSIAMNIAVLPYTLLVLSV